MNDKAATIRGGSKVKAARLCFVGNRADEIFFGSLDEFTSNTFRKAAFRLMSKKELKGKISGCLYES